MSQKYPTPDTLHLKYFENVYEPSDDTFLLVDALESEADFLKKLRPCWCFEIGSGSGLVISFLASILGPSSAYFATDLNISAARATDMTAVKNKVALNVFRDSLADASESRLKESIDILLFNPPYVISTDDEMGHTDIRASYAGGAHGTAVLQDLIPKIPNLLSPIGCFYCIISAENSPKTIMAQMYKLGLTSKIILKRKCINEILYAIKFFKLQ